MVKSRLSLKLFRSFTLIELLVVFSLISLFIGLGLAYYNDYNQRQKFNQEYERLYDVLFLAYKKSVSGDNSGYTSCSNFNGYRVSTVTNTQYQLRICCSSNCSSNSLLNSYNLPNNITIAPAPINITFKPLTGHTENSYTLTLSGPITKSITVNQIGKITKQ